MNDGGGLMPAKGVGSSAKNASTVGWGRWPFVTLSSSV